MKSTLTNDNMCMTTQCLRCKNIDRAWQTLWWEQSTKQISGTHTHTHAWCNLSNESARLHQIADTIPIISMCKTLNTRILSHDTANGVFRLLIWMLKLSNSKYNTLCQCVRVLQHKHTLSNVQQISLALIRAFTTTLHTCHMFNGSAHRMEWVAGPTNSGGISSLHFPCVSMHLGMTRMYMATECAMWTDKTHWHSRSHSDAHGSKAKCD